MKPTEALHAQGQSLWLDNITRGLLDSGQLQRYINDYDVTGLTSNPSIFDKAIESGDYNDDIRAKSAAGRSGEDLFFDLAIDDLRRAADLFLPIHERSDGVDGWVSLEVSPLLAYDTQATIAAASELYVRAARRNLFIKIPGTPEGLPAITECVANGVPINVTLLFSADQYRLAAEAFLDGVERRVSQGLDPVVGSVASLFMSRWDAAVADQVPAELKDKLALAVGLDAYRAYRQILDSPRAQRLENSGARMQRLLWASTSTKDPEAPDTLYVHGLAAPFTVNTMPDKTLTAFYDHGEVGTTMPADGGDCDAALARFKDAGVDVGALAAKLQSDGAKAFDKSWKDLMSRIAKQTKTLTAA
ncbi:MAG TPA: transaldolase [Streptosporangiaceae bacterium]|nr:transaldolase [Streptosporangiaceae bacterium]